MHSTKLQMLNQEAGVLDTIYFSPHLDDAVLSCGNQLAQKTFEGKRVAVITLFTRGSNYVHTSYINWFLRQSGEKLQETLFTKRRQEDIRALKTLGVPWYLHLDYIDALFRTSYPSLTTVFRGKVNSRDQCLCHAIIRFLRLIKRLHINADTFIYAPLGVGNHVDHIITHNLVTQVFHQHRLIYWEDVPYRSFSTQLYSRIAAIPCRLKRTMRDAPKWLERKRRAIYCYRSQIPGLLQNGLSGIDYIHEAVYEH